MIRLLDSATVGQIAAGEVVERPLSVVKELVENALDAGARRISVTVSKGGLDALEVSDDGTGIPRDDLRLSLARHATSKLSSAGDLERIATLGFRGEGLASIAAVARVRVASRVADAQIGYAVEAFGENVSEPEPVAIPVGTRVSVRALFENVPVRREFLRSPSAEFARISTFLATLALAYPSVTFALAHDGKPVWIFPGTDAIEQRLAHVFGPEPARSLLALDAPGVRGYVSRPGFDRGDRRMQLLFVNRRLLRSTLMAGAWTGGYSTFSLSGRQPYGVLFLDLDPQHVDPNVHPTKSDVRLRYPERVASVVRRAISGALEADARGRLSASLSFAPPRTDASNGVAEFSAPFETQAPFAFGESDDRGGLRVLAQLDATYILATDGRALVLVDQHAAHERVAYEAIAARARRAAPCEPLLVPFTVELPASDVPLFESVRQTLAEAGFEAEPFGEGAYRVLATPSGYGARAFAVRPFVEDLRDEIPGLGAAERIWATLACHSVARAGDKLEAAEMSALIAQLLRCENPMHCPHGRPTIVRIEPADVARMFKRT
ncbi:MAG: DNA mismatch repair endonuclease MutL [Candidatus Eremiobacteraeota bacterium]|nr:DNA mismatch repair endonuclease MutL [Candidatus Eremiobacteraeota bacterium]